MGYHHHTVGALIRHRRGTTIRPPRARRTAMEKYENLQG
jgi:hypothetical protein